MDCCMGGRCWTPAMSVMYVYLYVNIQQNCICSCFGSCYILISITLSMLSVFKERWVWYIWIFCDFFMSWSILWRKFSFRPKGWSVFDADWSFTKQCLNDSEEIMYLFTRYHLRLMVMAIDSVCLSGHPSVLLPALRQDNDAIKTTIFHVPHSYLVNSSTLSLTWNLLIMANHILCDFCATVWFKDCWRLLYSLYRILPDVALFLWA